MLENKDNTLEMHNKTRHNIIRHEPKRRRSSYQANQGPVRWRKKVKTYIKSTPNGAKLCRTHLEAQ
jgi:hypothetical protein